MRESRDDYIIRKIREDRMIDVGKLPITEIDIYKKNIADLQEQLQKSYIKQKSFLDELHELQKRKTISLVMEMKQMNFDFKPRNGESAAQKEITENIVFYKVTEKKVKK